MINDKIGATGELTIVLRDGNGNIKLERTVPNLVVTVGKGVIASRLASAATAVMSHMAVGTSATAANAANTTLGTEIARVALTVAGGTAVGAEVTYAATFPAGTGTGALVEAGILNAASVGSMLARTTFLPVNKDAADTLTISWKVTIN